MSDNSARDSIQDLFLLARLRSAARVAFDPLGFTYPEAVILVSIEGDEGRPKQLSELLRTPKSAVSTVINRLVAKGLVVRQPSKTDLRCIDLQLTEKGHDGVTEVKNAWAIEVSAMKEE